jgi:hypothetical protein
MTIESRSRVPTSNEEMITVSELPELLTRRVLLARSGMDKATLGLAGKSSVAHAREREDPPAPSRPGRTEGRGGATRLLAGRKRTKCDLMTMQFIDPRYAGQAPGLSEACRPLRSRPEIPVTIVGPLFDMVPIMAVVAIAVVALCLISLGVYLEARDNFRRTGHWCLGIEPVTYRQCDSSAPMSIVP